MECDDEGELRGITLHSFCKSVLCPEVFERGFHLDVFVAFMGRGELYIFD